jgi:hypothetical protein
MRTTALEPIPFCLLVPLVRVAEGLGTTADYSNLDSAGKAHGAKKVAQWLKDIEEELAGRKGQQPADTAWQEHLELGREARRRCSFVWEEPRVDQCVHRDLAASLKNPMGDTPEHGAAIHHTDVLGAVAPDAVYRWTVLLPTGEVTGKVNVAGKAGLKIAKRHVEHVFLAAWEASQ